MEIVNVKQEMEELAKKYAHDMVGISPMEIAKQILEEIEEKHAGAFILNTTFHINFLTLRLQGKP
jgi:hypothetical protein